MPVIVDARSELLFFSDAEAAERYLEAIDVENGAYPAAWLRTGQRVAITVVPAPHRSWWARLTSGSDAVSVTPIDGDFDDAGLLRRIHSARVPVDGDPLPDEATLAEHVDAVIARWGFIC